MKRKANRQLSSLQGMLEKQYFGKKLAILISMMISIITVLLYLPVFRWISVVNTESLYETLKVKEKAIALLETNYSLFNILSFVQHTRAGSIGLYSMILLFLIIAALYFNLVFLLRIIKKKNIKGNLSIYSAAHPAMIFSVILCIATIIYIDFANSKFGMTGFVLSPAVYLILIISIIAFIFIKLVESKERLLYREHGFLYELKKNWILFLMLVPTFLYLIINNYLPMVGVYYAFTSFNFKDGLWASPFVGFKNFEHLLKADLFKLTKNTILYNLAFIGIGNILQIAFAIFVSRVGIKWFKRTSQTLMFMPYFVSFVILKVLVYNLFEYQSGMINTAMVSLGLDRIDFYNEPSYWPYLITVFYLWKNIGYGIVVYLATIMGISDEYYDAAKVDGASILQQIRYITLPLIKPTFIILFLYALGSIMKGQFELFYQLVGTNGVLYNATDIFDTFVYRITTTQPLSIGMGTAAGLYQAVFGFIVILVTNFFVKRKNPDYALF
ncbi:MAG: transporter permease [Herbinix sp.]|jgi:ABC-type polysaccharide transport system permease subunit|nr:transporter permease [Herbinix sp.]